ncbi:MAG: 2-amino-4-hydroxy-6-hydroxymethyldihydropteridine diphosphokinase [Cyanobacteriota bacterium]
MHRYAVALGSNLGERLEYLRQGVAELEWQAQVKGLCKSRVYDTDPVGGPAGQDPYLNAAITFYSTLEPKHLLELLLKIEQQQGRVWRHPNGPRTLDLDLLLCDDLCFQQPGLIIPHPRLHLRAFVLTPLADIAPDWVIPGIGQSVRALLAGINRTGIRPTELQF